MRRKKKVSARLAAILIMTFLLLMGRSALSEMLGADPLSPSPSPGRASMDPACAPESAYPSPSPVAEEATARLTFHKDPASDHPLLSETELYSSNAIVIALDSKELLLDKGSRDKVYPASLTKLMTVITAIESLDDLKSRILITKELINKLTAENSSMAGFLPGEEVPAIDLLYGAMLPSGGECCMSLAEYIAGSETSFVQLMNEKATELGMDQTHFVNTTGLHDSKHYTTVWDLALLLQYALQNDTFRQIFTSQRHSTTPTNLHPDGITLYSTMFKKLPQDTSDSFQLLGGKTGYTAKAGLCLASLAKIGGSEYIMISAGAEGNHASEQYNLTDALTVYGQISSKQFVYKAGP